MSMETMLLHLVSSTRTTLGLDPIVTVLVAGWFVVITAAIWRRRSGDEETVEGAIRRSTARRDNRHAR